MHPSASDGRTGLVGLRVLSTGTSRAAVLWIVVSLLVQAVFLAPPVLAGGDGNASISLTKTVDAVTVTPRLGLSLVVDRDTAIPADELTYTATLSNIGSDLAVTGDITAANPGSTTATVAAYYDYLEYFSVEAGAWIPLAGTNAAQSGYTPQQAPPIVTGLILTADPQPDPNVTYPSTGDPFLGTAIARHGTGDWAYTATTTLTTSQVDLLLDPSRVSKIRNVIHLEVTPRAVKNGQPFTFRTEFAAALQQQSGLATDAAVTITPPSGDPVIFDVNTDPGLGAIGPGEDRTETATYAVPVPDPKDAAETDADYLARLAALDGRTLTATADATATGLGGHELTAPQASADTTEQLPILSIAKTGPATVDAGTTADYDLALANGGSAGASALAISDALPGGDTGTVSDVPATLSPGESATAHAAYDVPDSQPEGDLTDTASLTWQDGNANPYGPISDSFTTQVQNTLAGAHLVLAPGSAGPLVVGTDHMLTVTATNAAGGAIGGLAVQLDITGANATSTSLTTDASGQATFTYTGLAAGTDVAQASATRGGTTIQSNTAQAVWLQPVNPISTTQILARFFTSDGSGQFHATPAQTPAFSQYFPTIDFNPPAGTIPGNTSGVGVNTRPFSDVTTDLAGNYTGRIVAEGNGYQAGVGALFTMNAVFTGEFTVAAAGDQTFDFYSDDGFIFGIGNGATRVSGALRNPPASGVTPFEGYPVVGSYNDATAPVANSVTVHFPAAGTYPYELDYSECCSGQLVLTMASHASGHGVPPSGSLSLTPFTIAAKQTGQSQTMTVAAMDAAGQPLADLPVILTITGPNSAQISETTDSSGIATFTYVGESAGTDQLQVGANVSGSPNISNIVSLTWTTPPTPKPEIGTVGPEDGATVTEPVNITASLTPPAGQSISSWSVTYQRVGTTGTTVLASGSGTPPDPLATFDPTVLVNGTYTLTISATASGGGTQSTTISVVVDGNLKLGRYATTYQDLAVPVAGVPIQVLRTYDSFDKSVGDFGIGWRVELANFRASTGRALGAGGWTQYNVQCFFGLCITGYHSSVPHVVTVTWPDGHQELFDFTPGGGSNIFWTGTAAFTPQGRSTSTLEVDGNTSVSYIGDGNLYAGLFGTGGIYDPQRFRLTARDGTVYIIDRTAGLVSATDRNGNTLRVTANGVTSSLGPSITFNRDGQGRIATITDPANKTLSYTYDPTTGDLIQVTDQAGKVVRYGYDSAHTLVTVSGASGPPLRTLHYGADGRLESISDGAGNEIALSIDVAARTETIAGPDPRRTTINSYSERGDLVQTDVVFEGTHLTSTLAYNDLGLVVRSADPLGHESLAEYDDDGNLTQLTDRDGVVTDITYSEGQPVDVRVDGVLKTRFSYDSRGNLTRIEYGGDPAIYAGFGYGPQGELTSIRDVGGRTRTVTYDANGYPQQVDGPEGTTLLSYDQLGQLLDFRDPTGSLNQYRYDDHGRLTTVTDGNLHTWSLGYDASGRLASRTDPLDHSTTYGYDEAGRLATVIDRNGTITTLAYDADGHVVSRSATDGSSTTFAYDGGGRLTSAENEWALVTFSYDDASRPLVETVSGAAGSGYPTLATTRQWTDGGQLSSISDPNGTTSYLYDGQGRLASVADSDAGIFSFGYDSLDRVVTLARPNSVLETFGFSGELPSSWTATSGSATIDQGTLAYDARGFPSQLTDTDGIHMLAFDAAGRLTGATHPGTSGIPDEAYTYDAAGNRTSSSANPLGTISYDDANHLLSDASFTYQMDDEGRLVSRTDTASGDATTFGWNADGQLIRVDRPGAPAITYAYDPFGRRIQTVVGTSVQRTSYAGPNARLQLDGGNQVQARAVTGLGLDGLLATVRGSTASYPITDLNATIRADTDASGAITSTLRYDSFGNPATGTTPDPAYGWQGLATDPSGMLVTSARTYDPGTGRFLSEDPLPAINSYTYADNSPVLLSDRTGLQALAEYSSLESEESTEIEAVCLEGAWTASFIFDTAIEVGFSAALAPIVGNGAGLYSFLDTSGKPYVGKSIDLARRLAEHLRAGRITLSSPISVRNLDNIANSALADAEQLAIQGCGTPGKTVEATLANKINAVGAARRAELAKIADDLGAYLSSLGY